MCRMIQLDCQQSVVSSPLSVVSVNAGQQQLITDNKQNNEHRRDQKELQGHAESAADELPNGSEAGGERASAPQEVAGCQALRADPAIARQQSKGQVDPARW